MKTFIKLIVSIFFISIFFWSCNNYELSEVSEEEVDSLNFKFISVPPRLDNTTLIMATEAARGSSWRQWDDVYKQCMINESFGKRYYLGVSNMKGIGTIIDKKNNEVIRLLEDYITPDEYKALFAPSAEVKTCKVIRSKDFDFNAILDVEILGLDSAVKATITRADSSSMTGGSWEIREMKLGSFRDLVKTDPRLINFKGDLYTKGYYVITKYIKMQGFKSEIYTSSTIEGEVKAKLESGIIAGGFLKFRWLSDRVIEVQSTEDFYVFGKLFKATKAIN
ncbi:MAG: hypothetical protein ABL895_18635 [Cyclobacteriaceae bacterium]